MSMEATRGFCPGCEKMVRADRPAFNHTLHAILSLCSGCLWLPIWLLLWACHGGDYLCIKCGLAVLDHAPRSKLGYSFLCPHCDEELSAKKEEAGEGIRCPECRKAILVPRFLGEK